MGERRTWPPALNFRPASIGTSPVLVHPRAYLSRRALAYNEISMIAALRGRSSEISTSATPAEKPARILAIDYGRKRIGLALSDELCITARPFAALVRSNRREDLRRLREICRHNGVARILVGHPLLMSGEAGEMAQESARFAARLQEELAIETELVDERLTSWEAHETLVSGRRPKRNHRTAIDPLAAAILLRDHLDKKQAQAKFSPARKG